VTIRWRALAAGETDHELVWGWVLPACALMAGWLHLTHSLDAFQCWLKVATGVPCPTCGATRAFVALLGGNLLEAWRLNPLVPFGSMAGTVYVPYALVVSSLKRDRLRLELSPHDWRVVRVAFTVLVGATWAFLILDGR
jgi:hypothetical protein